MSYIGITLGPISFRSFEVPDRINLGGRQRLAVHRLTDGRRVIDSLGRDDADISFRGVLSGSDATMRARLLDVYRVAGEPLPLTWDVFFYSVIISRFEAVYENHSWIPYRIVCTVLRDEASSVIPIPTSLTSSLLDDIYAATMVSTDLPLDFSDIRTSLAAADATTRDSTGYAIAQAGIAGMQSNIAIQMAQSETCLRASMAPPGASVQDAVANLAAAAQSAESLAALATARAYVGRAVINLNNASN